MAAEARWGWGLGRAGRCHGPLPRGAGASFLRSPPQCSPLPSAPRSRLLGALPPHEMATRPGGRRGRRRGAGGGQPKASGLWVWVGLCILGGLVRVFSSLPSPRRCGGVLGVVVAAPVEGGAGRLVPAVVLVYKAMKRNRRVLGVRVGLWRAGEKRLVCFQIRERLSVQNVTGGKQASVRVPASRAFCGYA